MDNLIKYNLLSLLVIGVLLFIVLYLLSDTNYSKNYIIYVSVIGSFVIGLLLAGITYELYKKSKWGANDNRQYEDISDSLIQNNAYQYHLNELNNFINNKKPEEYENSEEYKKLLKNLEDIKKTMIPKSKVSLWQRLFKKVKKPAVDNSKIYDNFEYSKLYGEF